MTGCMNPKTPKSSKDFYGMQYSEVIAMLEEAGFNNIKEDAVQDIDSNSDIADGAVDQVIIDNNETFEEGTAYKKDATIIVKYHTIPKVKSSFSSDEVKAMGIDDILKELNDTGFVNITQKDVYDLDPDSISTDFINEVLVNEKPIKSEEYYCFDSPVSVISHHPYEKYTVNLNLTFISNWIFDKYDVTVLVNGEEYSQLKHGEDSEMSLRLKEGMNTISFTNSENSDVRGMIEMNVDSDIDASYYLSCYNDRVELKEEYVDHKVELNDNEVKMLNTKYQYLDKNYEDVVNELKDIGFTNITLNPLYDIIWGWTEEGSVSKVTINGLDSYKRGDVYQKDSEVIVTYHLNAIDDPNAQEKEDQEKPEETENPDQIVEEEKDDFDCTVYKYTTIRDKNYLVIYNNSDLVVEFSRRGNKKPSFYITGHYTGDLENGLNVTWGENGTQRVYYYYPKGSAKDDSSICSCFSDGTVYERFNKIKQSEVYSILSAIDKQEFSESKE